MSKRALIQILALLFGAALTATARADLVGWWAFDDDVEDQSGEANDGFMEFPIFDDNVPDAIGDGTSLSLDGNVGVEIAASPSLDSSVFTLSMFVFHQGQAAGYSRLTSREGDTFETALGTGAVGDELKYFSRVEGAWNTTAYELPPETWQHVAYVSDGVEITVYADGTPVYGPVPFSVNPSGFLHIGNRWNGIEGFIGLLDDVALFDQALDSDQIETIADVGTAMFLETFEPGDAPPARPSGLVATAGDGSVELAWTAVADADGYNVYRSDVSGGPYEKLNQDPVTMTTYSDTSVENGVRYYYVVTTVRGAEESLESSEIAATPRGPLEDPGSALVGWWTFDDVLSDRSGHQNHGAMNEPVFDDNVPDAIGGGKSIVFSGFGGVEIAPDPSLDSEAFTLAMFVFSRGQLADYSRLTSRENDSFESALGVGTAGDQLKYFSRAEGSWNVTEHEVPLEAWQHIAFVSNGTDLTIYADGEVVHGPVPLTTTPFGVMHIGDRFSNVEGFVGSLDDVALFDAPLSAEDIATIADVGVAEFLGNPPPPEEPPAPPYGLRVRSGDGQVQLGWAEVPDVSGYNIHRSEVAGGPYDQLNQDVLAAPGYLDTDVENDTRYYYVVTAVNDFGESALSSEAVGSPRAPVDAEDALVGWWPFDESVDDESGFGHDGFLDLPVFDDEVPDAVGEGTSLSLDGFAGVEILPSPDLDSDVFTLSMFVFNLDQTAGYSRTTSREGDAFETAVGNGGGGDQLKYFSLAEGAWKPIPHPVPVEVWQHVAYVSDGAELTVYVDGEVVHGPVPFMTAPSGVLHIGNRWNGIEGFIGLLDDVALFNEALTQDQIITISENGIAGLLGFKPVETVFVRGDTNTDGSLNITDAVFALDWLFGGGEEPSCRDAVDTNDDSTVNIADAVLLLGWLFGGGGELAPPAPPGAGYGKEDCGPDPVEDELDCARFEPCE